ncbi:hypothetical protein MFLAVUS_002505 [Mucor flavus]|uniref:Uncharacterized protein n=1 Tax=Mucor flavus TaxID=439312 RepID=A0ABP9YQH1_9FUNG
MENLKKRAENNSTRINNYIVKRALESRSAGNREEFTAYLESQGYKLTEETTKNSDNNTLSRAEAFAINQQCRRLLLRFKDITRTKMDGSTDTSYNSTQSVQNNNVTRDELAKILELLYQQQQQHQQQQQQQQQPL